MAVFHPYTIPQASQMASSCCSTNCLCSFSLGLLTPLPLSPSWVARPLGLSSGPSNPLVLHNPSLGYQTPQFLSQPPPSGLPAHLWSLALGPFGPHLSQLLSRLSDPSSPAFYFWPSCWAALYFQPLPGPLDPSGCSIGPQTLSPSLRAPAPHTGAPGPPPSP